MALSTFAQLKTAVSNWLERDDLSNRIPEFVALAESRIYATCRVREMEAEATITTTGAQAKDALPTRFRSAREVYVDATPDTALEYVSPVNYRSIYASQTSASPKVYTIVGENFVWGPVPDTTYTIKVDYYQAPAAFSADADTNSLLAKYPGLYLYGALLEAASFLEDTNKAIIFAQHFDAAREMAEKSDRMDRFSGYPLTQRDLVQVT